MSHTNLQSRQTAEDQLRMYERIFLATPIRLSLVDRNYIYRVVNEAYLKDSGKRYEEIVGHAVSELLGAAVFEHEVKAYLDRALGGEMVQYQAWFNFAHTGRQYVSVMYLPYTEQDGTITGVIVSARDITELTRAEQQLRQLARAVETMRLGITITDLQGVITYVNPAEAAMHGYTAEEVLGKAVGIFAPPELRKPLNLKLSNDERKFARESVNVHKDGSRFPVHLISDIVRDAQGAAIATVTTCEDITTRKQTEDALKQTNAELKARLVELSTLNQITQIVASTLDLQTILNSICQALIPLFQASSTGIGLFTPDRTVFTVLADAAARDEIPSTAGATIPTQDYLLCAHLFETRQAVVVTQAQTNPLTVPAHGLFRRRGIQSLMIVPLLSYGEVIGTFSADTDQPDRQFTPAEVTLAETMAGQIAGAIEKARLFQQEQQHRQVAESLQAVALILNSSLDRDVILEKVLEQLEHVLRYDGAAVFLLDADQRLRLSAGGKLGKRFVGQRIALDTDDPVAQVFYQKRPVMIANVHTHPGWHVWPGGETIQSWMGAPLLIGDQAIGVLTVDSEANGIYHDEEARILLTFANQAAVAIHNARLFEEAQRARQAAEAANQTKTQFLANMSHELRTPLNSIIGFAELLSQNQAIPAQEREHIRIIHRGGQHLLTLINDLLDLAKVQSGHLTFNPVRCDLVRLIDHVADMFRLRAEIKGLQFSVACAPGTPHVIQADEIKLRQVLVNLLSNAVKFTEAGSVILRILDGGFERLDPKSQIKNLKFEIIDTGPGIPTGQVERLMDAFGKIAVEDGWREGVGLGLALSRQFVAIMGGTLSIASVVGQGTTVTCTLPYHPSDEELWPFDASPEATASAAVPSEPSPLALAFVPARLASLPADLLTRLRDAATTGDIDAMDLALEALRPHDAMLADALNLFAQDFDYGKMLDLLPQ